MATRIQRKRPRAWRQARSPVEGVSGKLDNLECQVANLSSTGAMLRSRVEVPVGHEARLSLLLGEHSAAVRVQVVRCEAVETPMPGEAVWRRQDFALGVKFLDRSADLTTLIRTATREISGIEHTEPRILVIG